MIMYKEKTNNRIEATITRDGTKNRNESKLNTWTIFKARNGASLRRQNDKKQM